MVLYYIKKRGVRKRYLERGEKVGGEREVVKIKKYIKYIIKDRRREGREGG